MLREDLVAVLKAVLPGIDKNNALLQNADSFVFDDEWVKSYNDNLSISFPFEIGVSCVIKAIEFYNILTRMKGDEVSLSMKGGKLIMTDEITEVSMNVFAASPITQCIENVFLEDIEWKDLPLDFQNGLDLCLYSVIKDPIYGEISGVFISDRDMISTDNVRASWYRLISPIDGTFIFPLGSAKELVKMGALERYALGTSWVHFEDEFGAIFSSRLLVGSYPAEKIKAILSVEKGDVFKFPEGAMESIDRVSVFSSPTKEDRASFLRIQSDGQYLHYIGERDFGSAKDKSLMIDDPWPDGIEVCVNPKFLKTILSTTDTFYIPTNRYFLFETENFSHAVCLVSLK